MYPASKYISTSPDQIPDDHYLLYSENSNGDLSIFDESKRLPRMSVSEWMNMEPENGSVQLPAINSRLSYH